MVLGTKSGTPNQYLYCKGIHVLKNNAKPALHFPQPIGIALQCTLNAEPQSHGAKPGFEVILFCPHKPFYLRNTHCYPAQQEGLLKQQRNQSECIWHLNLVLHNGEMSYNTRDQVPNNGLMQ